MLDFITHYESVQVFIVIGLGAIGLALAVSHTIRKTQLTDAEVAERKAKLDQQSHLRKLEWHNVTTKPTIEHQD